MLEKLGTVPDHELALELGISHQAVTQMRRKLDIPSYRDREHDRRRECPPEIVELLGKQPDSEIAEAFGVPAGWVRARRKERGIPKYVCTTHGTTAMYNQGCRCAGCRGANAARRRHYLAANPDALTRAKTRALAKVLASAPHVVGKIGWYAAGCRCEGCKDALREYNRDKRDPNGAFARRRRARLALSPETEALIEGVADGATASSPGSGDPESP